MTLPNADLLCYIAAASCLLLGLFCLMMLGRRRIRPEFVSTMRAIAGFNFVISVCMLLLAQRVDASAIGLAAMPQQRDQPLSQQVDHGHDIIGELLDTKDH
ncbi:hypothetical protein KDL44_00610 [bacterium]|nr:hypothetical protein [bacterium]